MREAYHTAPPRDPIEFAAFQRRAEMDLALRAHLKEMRERLPLLTLCRVSGGSGFRLSRMIREFFQDYINRIAIGGPTQLPTSFNVVEAFLRFSEEYAVFDLREEQEHLLRAYDFFDWYTSEAGTLISDPGVLKDMLDDGVMYSYDMVGTPHDFFISTPESRLALLGVSLIRHEDELSVILLAGEDPPYPTDDDVLRIAGTHESYPGKENIEPDPSLTTKSRLVPGLPNYSTVILLTRIYLDSRRYDVRYVHLDIGKSYLVYTDDPTALGTRRDRERQIEAFTKTLDRYADLFSALTALIYLPVYFTARDSQVVRTKFATELKARKNNALVRRAFRLLGEPSLTFYREVKCLCNLASLPNVEEKVVSPPALKSFSEGFWKDLEYFEFGEDEDGNPIAGKTWVERKETWFTHDPTSFVVRRINRDDLSGPDPGMIYVIRSPAHEKDLYKIGLTRRAVDLRAYEIGQSTGVPLPFGVLANWEVGDCSNIEGEIHQGLASYRVSKRREFFRAPLATIIKVINEVVKRGQNRSSTP